MRIHLTREIHTESNGFVARCPQLDIATQGDTVKGARKNLAEAVEGFLAVASPTEIRRRLKHWSIRSSR